MAYRETGVGGDGQSLGRLVSGLGHDVGLLVRQEVELAKAEIKDQVGRTLRDAIGMGVGGVLAALGGVCFLAAAILGLIALGVVAWLAALIIGVVLMLAGYVVFRAGRSAMGHDGIAPRRTARTLRDDVSWAKEQLR